MNFYTQFEIDIIETIKNKKLSINLFNETIINELLNKVVLNNDQKILRILLQDPDLILNGIKLTLGSNYNMSNIKIPKIITEVTISTGGIDDTLTTSNKSIEEYYKYYPIDNKNSDEEESPVKINENFPSEQIEQESSVKINEDSSPEQIEKEPPVKINENSPFVRIDSLSKKNHVRKFYRDEENFFYKEHIVSVRKFGSRIIIDLIHGVNFDIYYNTNLGREIIRDFLTI